MTATENAWTRLNGEDIHAERAPLPWRYRIAIGGAIVTTIVFVVVVPLWALWQPWDVSTKASVIQASISVIAAILAIGAGVLAILAYRISIQRPNLNLAATTQRGVLRLVLINNGTRTATRPVVNVHAEAVDGEVHFNGRGWSVKGPTEDPAAVFDPVNDHVSPGGFSYLVQDLNISIGVPSEGQPARDVRLRVTWVCEGELPKRRRYQIQV